MSHLSSLQGTLDDGFKLTSYKFICRIRLLWRGREGGLCCSRRQRGLLEATSQYGPWFDLQRYNALLVLGDNVCDNARLMKSDVSGRETADIAGYWSNAFLCLCYMLKLENEQGKVQKAVFPLVAGSSRPAHYSSHIQM